MPERTTRSGKPTVEKPEPSSVSSCLSRFAERLVTLAKHAVSSDPAPAVKKGDGGYADWVIAVIQGCHEYFDLPYWRLLDVFHEMRGIVEKIYRFTSDLRDTVEIASQTILIKARVYRGVADGQS
ncbi:hypothetical protein [Natrinema marinum]|uniref:hypothetical protein n=1 Tax=Natrinema marinum TaxID=2961598 RepID=UPI0020C83F2E|nr:hypothetical protein [Natrinema marinum]